MRRRIGLRRKCGQQAEVTDGSNHGCKSSKQEGHSHARPLPAATFTFTMRNFWALPAVLRIALASQHAFSVFDDLLSFPQV
jgi:hypothetical protein